MNPPPRRPHLAVAAGSAGRGRGAGWPAVAGALRDAGAAGPDVRRGTYVASRGPDTSFGLGFF